MTSRFFQSCHSKFNSAFAFGKAEFAFNLYSLCFINVILLFITNFVFLGSAESRSGKTSLSLCGILFGIRFLFTPPVFIGNMGIGIFMTYIFYVKFCIIYYFAKHLPQGSYPLTREGVKKCFLKMKLTQLNLMLV